MQYGNNKAYQILNRIVHIQWRLKQYFKMIEIR